jgi:putative ABC transport system substrate-binding protein
MRRRDLILGLAGAAVVGPRGAWGQKVALPVIGFLSSASSGTYEHLVRAFKTGLAETGYNDGKNVSIEYRWAEDRYDSLPVLAADLVNRHVSVIVPNGPAARPAKAATTTIPITFFVGFDPVGEGLVAAMNRPGGNMTGVSALTVELVPKRLELLHELIPTATGFAVLINPKNPNVVTQLKELTEAARSFGLQLKVLHANELSLSVPPALLARADEVIE